MENVIEDAPAVDEKIICYHCGDTCDDRSVSLESHYFCCHGCKTVYSIIQDNGLDTYYALNAHAGTSLRQVQHDKYAYLDDAETINRLISYTDDEKSIIRLYIPQIHCSSCLWLLEQLPRLDQRVLQSRVNFRKKEMHITFTHDISLREVVEWLHAIGYGPHIVFDDLSEHKKPPVDRSLYYKLGLAGFVFGNVMLLSFPEYLGLEHSSIDSGLGRVFSYLNICLILPVLFYSGIDYYRSAWQGIKHGHLNIDVPISIGITALFLRSVYEIVFAIGPGYLDSLAGLIFFLLVGRWFQQITYANITFDRDFRSYFPIACTVQDGEHVIQKPLDKVNIGDRVIVHNGELIPTDGMLMSDGGEIDYSFVTGESAPVNKSMNDMVFAGGRQMGGRIDIIVTKKVDNSYLTSLWNDDAFAKEKSEGQTSKLANTVGKFFTWAILSIAFATLTYWLIVDKTIALNAFTSVLIIACPCAVALSIPFAFGNVVRLLGQRGIYIKNTRILEYLSRINHLVFDKTGTITTARANQLTFHGKPLTREEKELIHSLASQSMHPVSKRLAAAFASVAQRPVHQFNEITGKGTSGIVGGYHIRIGSAIFLQAPDTAARGVHIEINGEYRGSFDFDNAWRPGLSDVVNSLANDKKLSILSGDIDTTKEELQAIFGEQSTLLFQQSPQEKLDAISKMQAQGDHVLMIGDGLNDAGALSKSDVGVVITENSANFTPACDIILHARHFALIPNLLQLAQRSVHIVFFLYGLAFVYNVVGLSFAVRGLLSPVIAAILMPLSSITIVIVGVGLTTLFTRKLIRE